MNRSPVFRQAQDERVEVRLYPAMLRVEGQRCVVIGGGKVAQRKIERLLEAGADVTVVAPTLSPELARWADQGSLRCERRPYRRGDLSGAALVFAATDSRQVNAAVAEDAQLLALPINVADDPAGSSFQVPAVIEREGLTLAVSTGGRSPAFARRLREELLELLSPERLALLDLYAELRASLSDEAQPRDGVAWAAVDSQALDLLRRGRREEAREVLRQQVCQTPLPLEGGEAG